MKLSLAVPLFHPSQTSVLVNHVALAVVLIIALSVRFYSIAVPVIWYDEAYSLLLARETPARIWALAALDVHPPLYYVLLHYWVAMWGDAALPARAMSALADVSTLLLCVKLMSLISTRRATWVAALLLALLPISVRYSQEVRMYTLLGFWLMGATVALVCWARAPDRKGFAVIYVLLMSAAFYTHYFAGLCVLVHWLFWWQSRVTRNGISFSLWIVANLGIVLLYLPWIPHFIEQLGDTGGLDWIKPVSLHGALTLVWQFTVLGATSSQSSIWYLAPFFLMLLFAVTLIVSDAGERRFNLLLVSYFFVPLIALYLIALVLPLFVPRYLVFSAPALAMITAVALDKWGAHWTALRYAVLLICVVAQLYGLTMVYRQSDGLNGTAERKDAGFSALVTQLNQNARPGDEIIIASVYWFPTFAYYSTTGIAPRFEVRSSIDGFLRLVSRGAASLIDDPVMSAYIDGVTVLDSHNPRIWWITGATLSADRPLFAKGRIPVMILHGGNISAYLFTLDSVPTSMEVGTPVALMPR